MVFIFFELMIDPKSIKRIKSILQTDNPFSNIALIPIIIKHKIDRVKI